MTSTAAAVSVAGCSKIIAVLAQPLCVPPHTVSLCQCPATLMAALSYWLLALVDKCCTSITAPGHCRVPWEQCVDTAMSQALYRDTAMSHGTVWGCYMVLYGDTAMSHGTMWGCYMALYGDTAMSHGTVSPALSYLICWHCNHKCPSSIQIYKIYFFM